MKISMTGQEKVTF